MENYRLATGAYEQWGVPFHSGKEAHEAILIIPRSKIHHSMMPSLDVVILSPLIRISSPLK